MSEAQSNKSASAKKDNKKERLAAQLRANLRKRKAQSQNKKSQNTTEVSRDEMGDKE